MESCNRLSASKCRGFISERNGLIEKSEYMIHMDDILIYAPNIDEHKRRLKEVFSRLRSSS